MNLNKVMTAIVRMFQYRRGQSVRRGHYWDRTTWSIVELSGHGGTLPGDSRRRYVRIPLLLMLVAAPILGGLYVLLLPFIGFAMIVAMLTAAAWSRVHS